MTARRRRAGLRDAAVAQPARLRRGERARRVMTAHQVGADHGQHIETHHKELTMDTVLWILQSLLAGIFLRPG